MTPEERQVRFNVGVEIIEGVILDFLCEHKDDTFSSSQVREGLDVPQYSIVNEILRGLHERELIVNHKEPQGPANHWQAV